MLFPNKDGTTEVKKKKKKNCNTPLVSSCQGGRITRPALKLCCVPVGIWLHFPV